MTLASPLPGRLVRSIAAFVVLLSALVLVPGEQTAEAAGDGLSVLKTVDNNEIAYGAVSAWTLTVETDADAASAIGITVTDSVPDGLCLVGAGDPDCPGGSAPSPAFTSAVENADGSWTVSWDLPDMGPSELATITYSTVTRTHYQEGFADAAPILARDSWNNTVHLSGTVDGAPVDDYSAASQAAGPVALVKEVATRPATLVGPAVCGDGSSLTWNSAQADGYGVGDQVCWRLTVDYPADVATLDTVIADVLPPGHLYTAADTWAPGSGNTVPTGDIDGSTIGTGVSTLAWNVGDAGGYVAAGLLLEIVFSSTIVDPTATTSGQTVANTATVAHVNSNGSSYNSTDNARVEVVEPEIDLVKGVIAVNGLTTGGSNNVDGVEVMDGDVVTYQLTITNTGDLDANTVELWDVLPANYAICSSNVGTISDGGICSDGSNRIEWTGAASFDIAAGGTEIRTYEVTIPTGIAPDETMNNNAGIRSFSSVTNNGSGAFTYVPVGNIDSGISGQNTARADDPSHVFTGIPTIGHTRTTSVADAGNDPHWQATIGEIITYTVTVVVPEGTTVYSAGVVDDLPANLDLVSSSHTYDGAGLLAVSEDGTTDTVQVAWPDPYTNPAGSGDDTLVLTIAAQVLDIPMNSRDVVVDNSAEFTWFDADAGQRDIHASITTTIVEPSITIDKTSIDSFGHDGFVVGGELVDTTLTVINTNQANVATAYDVVVVDTLPEGVTPTIINDSGVWVADTNPGDGVGGTITWNLSSVAPGVPATPSYQVAVDDPVIVNSVFTNSVAVTTTSMAGGATGERSAGTGYTAADAVTLNSPLASITKSAIPTSATIGEVVTYSIAVAIPPGSIMYDATVLDVLPSDLSFDGITSTSCTMGAVPCVPALDVQHLYNSGQTYSFFLGDIASSSAASRVVTIVYDAHVDNTVAAGAIRTNGATIFGNTTDVLAADPGFVSGPFDVSTGPAATTIDIVEPTLTIDKDVSAQSGDSDWRRAKPGDFLDYTLLVANTGTDLSPAHEITVVDTLPAGVSDPSLISGGGVWASGPRTITWTVPGPLHPETSRALSYRVYVDAALDWTDENAAAAELVNIADVASYYGVPAAERIANGFDYIIYTDTVADTVSVELDLAQIGDYVWFDVDGDGAQDGAEPGLAGVDMTVTYHGADATYGTGDDEVFNTATGPGGTYGVSYLPGGIYTVAVDSTDLPAGMVASYNLDGTLDHVWSGSLFENGNDARVDFGYTGTGSIGDTVWFDNDADGVHDGSEYGLEDVEITVTWLGMDGTGGGGDDAAYVTTTDPAGKYLVEDLPAGNYTIAVTAATLPAGMVPTHDSDGLGVPPHTSTMTLGPDEDNVDQNFGYAGTGSIGDFVWFDGDGDGTQDLGEPGLVGVPIQLTWPGEDGALGGGDDEPILTTTDGGGNYLFGNLPAGTYQIDILGGLPGAAVNTADPDGGADSSAVVNLSDGTDQDSTDFGYHGTASIGDTVWWDRDGDDAVTIGEPGIPGVEITLTYAGPDGVAGNSDDLSFTRITDGNGNYLFSDLPEGNYIVAVTGGVPAGLALTYDENGPVDGISSVTALAAAELHLTADFAYTGALSIGDYVWLDLNSDGVQDGGEPGIPGVGVHLIWYGADGSEGNADDVALSTTTDIDGNYVFSGLPVGGYDVVIDPATLPVGLAATSDSDGLVTPHFSSLSLGAGVDNPDQDFGYVGGRAAGGTIWFDQDGDGAISASEYGLVDVSVDVVWGGPDGFIGNGDDEAFSGITDSAGDYRVGSLPPGEYRASVDPATLPAGMSATFDEDFTLDDQTTFTLSELTDHLSADFGYSGSGQIGDNVWLDLDADGGQNAAEPGLGGQTVELIWAGADGTLGNADDQWFATTTDGDGAYSFANLPPGAYDVVVTGSIVGSALNTTDEDGDLDSHTGVNLGTGTAHLSADFGYTGTAEIGDFIWLDLDGNGSSGTDEPGLAGVDVELTWYGPDAISGNSDDVTLPSYTTDPAGNYLAVGLPDGAYGVAVVAGVPAGLANSSDEDGDHDGQTGVPALSAGAGHLSADFGYAGTGSIGDFVWWDLDGDGAQDDDEPGFPNIDITLVWAGLDAVPGTGDDIVFDTSTDGGGTFLFEHLPPGQYTVTTDETALPAAMIQSGDPDETNDGASEVTIGAAETQLAQDFGYRGEGSIGGHVWYDLDDDQVQAPEEPIVAAAAVTIVYLGEDGVAGGSDDFSFMTTTDQTGRYALPGLPSGFYSVAIDDTTLPPGTTATSDLDGGDPLVTFFTLGASAHKTDVDYRVAGDASLHGVVWDDSNGDQIRDGDEPGVPGVAIVVTWNSPTGPNVISIVSNPDGSWSLPALPPGDYDLELDLSTVPAGMMPTTATSAAVSLMVGGQTELDFGIATVVDVGSTVWIDNDGDGVVDPGEAGIPNVLVNLYDEAGLLIGIAETDNDGGYLLSDLLPGTYLVQLDPASLPDDVLATWDRDGSPDLTTVLDLTIGLDVLNADFGFQVGLPVTGLELERLAISGIVMLLLGAALAAGALLRREQIAASESVSTANKRLWHRRLLAGPSADHPAPPDL